MRVLALGWFDPASVVLSHRDLMRSAGHDFRLAVVRAYTERQQQADYVCERLVRRIEDVAPGVHKAQVYWEKLNPDLESLREFAKSADVIQFHPGIGHGDGDWASWEGDALDPWTEFKQVSESLRLDVNLIFKMGRVTVAFIHGSMATRRNLGSYADRWLEPFEVATSTIDYAHELDAAYLPPLVDVGSLRARPRGDDDPLLIAHTPTDRIACSTEEFLKAAQGLGIPVRLGEGLAHSDVLHLKAECNAGFDHLRGAFSTNTLENAAIGLVPLHAMKDEYVSRMLNKEAVEIPPFSVAGVDDLRLKLRRLSNDPAMTRKFQDLARRWWETHFSTGPITKRLVQFYESL